MGVFSKPWKGHNPFATQFRPESQRLLGRALAQDLANRNSVFSGPWTRHEPFSARYSNASAGRGDGGRPPRLGRDPGGAIRDVVAPRLQEYLDRSELPLKSPNKPGSHLFANCEDLIQDILQHELAATLLLARITACRVDPFCPPEQLAALENQLDEELAGHDDAVDELLRGNCTFDPADFVQHYY